MTDAPNRRRVRRPWKLVTFDHAGRRQTRSFASRELREQWLADQYGRCYGWSKVRFLDA